MHARRLTIYSYFRSSTAYRVRIGLNLKNAPHVVIPVHLLRDGGEQRKDAYRCVNPQMRVPSLVVEENGTESVLIQAPAILEWLDEVYSEPPFLPRDPAARAKARAIAAVIACDIHPLDNLSTLEYLRNKLDVQKAELDEWYAYWIMDGFSAIEKLLEPAPFAVGTHPTVADICLVPQVYNARRFKVPIGDFPKIEAVARACQQLEAFSLAAPENQPDAE